MRTPPLLLAALLAAACSTKDEPPPAPAAAPPAAAPRPPPPPPPPPPPDAAPANPRPASLTDADLEHSAAVGAWFTSLTSAARGAGTDCAAIASALTSVGAKGRPLVARAKSAAKKVKDRTARAWLEEHTSTTMQNGFLSLMEAIGPCEVNPAVKKAMKSLAK